MDTSVKNYNLKETKFMNVTKYKRTSLVLTLSNCLIIVKVCHKPVTLHYHILTKINREHKKN